MSATRKRNLKRAGLATIIAAIAALLIVAIAGGGGKKPLVARTPKTPAATTSTTSTSTTPGTAGGVVLSAAEYRKRANAICNELPNPPSQSQMGSSMETLAPITSHYADIVSQAMGRLSGLRPPPDLATQTAKALALEGRVIEVVQQMSAAEGIDDRSGAISAYEQGEGLLPQAAAAWREVGVTC